MVYAGKKKQSNYAISKAVVKKTDMVYCCCFLYIKIRQYA